MEERIFTIKSMWGIDHNWWKVLHLVCKCGDINIVTFLLDNGVNPNSIGETPFELDSCVEVKNIIYRYQDIIKLREWRPWNHSNYPLMYRRGIVTLVLLAKTTRFEIDL